MKENKNVCGDFRPEKARKGYFKKRDNKKTPETALRQSYYA